MALTVFPILSLAGQKEDRMRVFMLALTIVLTLPMNAISSEDASGVAAARILELFRGGKLDEAQKIADKNYQRTDAYVSLLSGMIYAEKGECEKAKEKILYVEEYYDENYFVMSGEEKEEIADIYTNIKRVSIKCNGDLGLWGDQVRDLGIYQALVGEDEQYEVSALLADAYRNLAITAIERAIDEYERTLSTAKSNGEKDMAEDALFRLQELYFRAGSIQKAREYMSMLLENTSRKEEWLLRMEKSSVHKIIFELVCSSGKDKKKNSHCP